MKYLLILTIALSSSKCSNDYDSLLEGLSENYVLLSTEMEMDLYLEYFKLTEKQHEQDLKNYNKSLEDFYNADKEILTYLIGYENDTSHFCKWIKTKNPYSSKIEETDLITNSQGALLLLDNYLRGGSSITVPLYSNELSYDKIKSFLANNKGLDRSGLRNEYLKVISDGSN